MYLRLKQHCPSGIATSPRVQERELTLPALRNELFYRHYTAFDWQNGGPPGPIKFVDLHQLELAAHLARNGDDRAATMVKCYVRGVERLASEPECGAAHYATGTAWNTPCRARTLAGQAIAIQALVVAGRLERSHYHARLGARLARFVTAVRTEVTASATHASAGMRTWSTVCERAWYLAAIGAFAELYDIRRLRTDALAGFDQLASELCAGKSKSGRAKCRLTLADRIAVAAAANEFRGASGDEAFTRFARRALIDGASRHAHPDGCWVQRYRDGAPPDIDCSIDLVRIADALRLGPDGELARVAADGKRALFAPQLALARTPESGLLLLLADTTGNRRSRSVNAPPSSQSPRFAVDRDKLLVNVRK